MTAGSPGPGPIGAPRFLREARPGRDYGACQGLRDGSGTTGQPGGLRRPPDMPGKARPFRSREELRRSGRASLSPAPRPPVVRAQRTPPAPPAQSPAPVIEGSRRAAQPLRGQIRQDAPTTRSAPLRGPLAGRISISASVTGGPSKPAG